MNTTHGTFYPSASDKKPELKPRLYRCFLMSIAGLGGLLYGIDIGIISAALLYLGKTAHLTVAQTSAIMAAVLAGSMLGSLIAGILADLAGRKKMMSISGFLFVSSVLLIVMSHGFMILFCGRLLQGLSGGVIAVVVPLFLAETLSAETRGQGSAVFQFMLTFGIVLAAVIGWYFILRQTPKRLDKPHAPQSGSGNTLYRLLWRVWYLPAIKLLASTRFSAIFR
jgi:MFS family permease